MTNWMIYGANGYTGELLAREAARRGQKPVLAGRSAEKITALARELGCEARLFELDRIDLTGVSLVVHCAGPFSRTSAPMVRACLDRAVHYLDITGEIAVFESVFAKDEEAKQRGVVLLPGVGFDVVPTDCLAAMLHRRLPDAVELWLAFAQRRGGVSRGTMNTMIESIGQGGAIRRDGKIERVPMLFDIRTIPFERGTRPAMTIPWGDIATAYRTTQIPNIRVYRGASAGTIKRTRRLVMLEPLLRNRPAKKILQMLIAKRTGPDEKQRAEAHVELWGRVANARGEEKTMTMRVAEGYTFTVLSALAAVERVLAAPPPAGALTPALAFGPEFVKTIPGTVVNE